MRARCLLATVSVALATIIVPSVAKAEPMDPALERLVLNPGCHQRPGTAGGEVGDFGSWNPIGGPGNRGKCRPDNVAFTRLVNQYGAALAPTTMHTARTTGYAGVELALEASFTNLDDGGYMRDGTRGKIDPNTHLRAPRNDSPDAVAQTYYLKIRKGFPWGFELQGVAGTMAHTSFFIVGADIRLALLEGFRKGFAGYLPDVAGGGAVRTVTGSPQLQLTTVAAFGHLSKPITIASSSVITPFVGYQYLWIFGDSGLIDTTPNTDPLGYCGYTGPNSPGTPGADPNNYSGRPVCKNGPGSDSDFNNTVAFDPVRLSRQRVMGGINYRWEMISVAVQYMTDVVKPSSMNKNSSLEDVPLQYTISGHLGVIF